MPRLTVTIRAVVTRDASKNSPFLEIALVLVCLDHVARINRRRSGEVQRVPQPCCLKKERERHSLIPPRSTLLINVIFVSCPHPRQPTLRLIAKQANGQA
jgi:hypothetical protein